MSSVSHLGSLLEIYVSYLYNRLFSYCRGDRRLREQVRVLQNQNRFLNEEVKKLAQLQQKERDKYKLQDEYVAF